MKDNRLSQLAIGPSPRFWFWSMATLTLALLAGGWLMTLATDIPRRPGGEVIGGPLLIGLCAFGLLLIADTLMSWARLTAGEKVFGIFLGILALVSLGPLNG